VHPRATHLTSRAVPCGASSASRRRAPHRVSCSECRHRTLPGLPDLLDRPRSAVLVMRGCVARLRQGAQTQQLAPAACSECCFWTAKPLCHPGTTALSSTASRDLSIRWSACFAYAWWRANPAPSAGRMLGTLLLDRQGALPPWPNCLQQHCVARSGRPLVRLFCLRVVACRIRVAAIAILPGRGFRQSARTGSAGARSAGARSVGEGRVRCGLVLRVAAPRSPA